MALNTRQRMYAKCRAAGMEQLPAYETAGYASDDGNACHLDKVPEVQDMVNTLQDKALRAANVTPDAIINLLMDKVGQDDVKHADQIRALELVGKWLAMWKEVLNRHDVPMDEEIINRLSQVAPQLVEPAKAMLANSSTVDKLKAG